MSDTLLSLVLPAYNEERRLPETLNKILRFLDAQPYSAEVIVVENGSRDCTLEIAQEAARHDGRVQALKNTARGKGLAVQRGMLAARGEYRFMCDVDLSMSIEQVNLFLPPHLSGYSVAIGSREAPGARRFGEPAYRHFVGRIYNWLIRQAALPGLQDTQCGFKSFHASVVETLFRSMTLPGWSFDVEILFIAQRRGLKIIEVPIQWQFNPDSKISVWRDSYKMGMDLLTIRRNAARGVYDRA